MPMENKTKLMLMPLCVLLGTVLLFAFVSVSQNYLSDYFVRNSKSLVGQKVDLEKLAERLGDSRILGYTKAHSTLDVQIVFWSLSCSPCLEHLSSSKMKSSGNLILPVNVDKPEDADAAEKMLQQLAPQFTFYQDRNEFMMKTFKVDYLPTYVVIDHKGFIKDVKAGPQVSAE
jgi:hypothetical protein